MKKILHPSRIGEFNPYNRDYPIHYVVDCLIWHLWGRQQNWVVYWATAPKLKAENTPQKWYTYTVKASKAYEFCCKTLALADGAKIDKKRINPLLRKSAVSLEDRELIIAESIQKSLPRMGGTLRAFLENSYGPWAEVILEAIK